MTGLPKGWTEVALGELMPKRRGTIDPRRFAYEEFSLLSIPAFDAGSPERVLGSAVGSSKQLVEPGDVLLAKIVPHIRRAWVVPADDRRSIGSSEWIVFRDASADSGYLRHLLVSDRFHRSFMQTVAGVGGSLLRARPAYVAKLKVPLPPLEEQRRIAAILDKADELRAKRRTALEHLDSLTQAIFLDMFGDRLSDQRTGHWIPLDKLIDPARPICYGILKPGPDLACGVPYVRVVDMREGSIDQRSVRRTSEEIDHKYRRSRLSRGDLLMSIRGHVGRLSVVPRELDGANITQDSARVSIARAEPLFVLEYLRTPVAQRWMHRNTKGVAVRGINIGDVRRIPVPQVPVACQRRFVAVVDRALETIAATRSTVTWIDELFLSLQSRAFRGEL